MLILELFETSDSVKGRCCGENQINKNFTKTRGDILNIYGNEVLQFFEP